MKTAKYQRRFYRDWIKAKDLHEARIAVKETDLQIFSGQPIDKAFTEERIKLYRRQIEDYIAKDNRFLNSLKPIAVELHAPLIIRKMAQAAKAAGVGPMAAVAGAIAELLGRDLLRRGSKEIIVENGGDIFLKLKKARKVGIYAGKSHLWKGLGIKVRPQDTPLGICASSGTIGHSLSFGKAESAVVLAKDAFLADAAATAACNRVQAKEGLKNALDFSCAIKGVKAAVIIFKNNLASRGKVEFVR